MAAKPQQLFLFSRVSWSGKLKCFNCVNNALGCFFIPFGFVCQINIFRAQPNLSLAFRNWFFCLFSFFWNVGSIAICANDDAPNLANFEIHILFHMNHQIQATQLQALLVYRSWENVYVECGKIDEFSRRKSLPI